ncbi:MAG: hypothetical protein K2I84_00120, partial [Bacteroidales bacterium]|nr:hypothetical protein [Bacteroidales bacterium]
SFFWRSLFFAEKKTVTGRSDAQHRKKPGDAISTKPGGTQCRKAPTRAGYRTFLHMFSISSVY